MGYELMRISRIPDMCSRRVLLLPVYQDQRICGMLFHSSNNLGLLCNGVLGLSYGLAWLLVTKCGPLLVSPSD